MTPDPEPIKLGELLPCMRCRGRLTVNGKPCTRCTEQAS